MLKTYPHKKNSFLNDTDKFSKLSPRLPKRKREGERERKIDKVREKERGTGEWGSLSGGKA